jgi:hypothetical protein
MNRDIVFALMASSIFALFQTTSLGQTNTSQLQKPLEFYRASDKETIVMGSLGEKKDRSFGVYYNNEWSMLSVSYDDIGTFVTFSKGDMNSEKITIKLILYEANEIRWYPIDKETLQKWYLKARGKPWY